MNRLAVVAKLRPDMAARAQELIDMGPPAFRSLRPRVRTPLGLLDR
jgi:hypothetical protein